MTQQYLSCPQEEGGRNRNHTKQVTVYSAHCNITPSIEMWVGGRLWSPDSPKGNAVESGVKENSVANSVG